jgi:NADH:ubiquinone oxidoreductase subunit 2 (subunit N)
LLGYGKNLDFISHHLFGFLIFVSALSMIIGAIAGLTQPRIKRLLAYSSVLNVGFILLSVSVMTYSNQTLGCANQIQGLNGQWILYLGQYVITTAGIWLCLLAYANQYIPRLHTKSCEITTTSELQGMSAPALFSLDSFFGQKKRVKDENNNLFLACTMTILLFSTAGIPPMVGFFAKFEVISTALISGFYYLSLIAIIASLISTVYYLRIIRAI